MLRVVSTFVLIAFLCEPGITAETQKHSRISIRSVKPPLTNRSTASRVERYGLTRNDHEAILAQIDGIALSIPIRETVVKEVRYTARAVSNARVVGSSEKFLQLEQLELSAGRNLNADDLKDKGNVTVISHDLKSRLFETTDAVGKSVRLHDRFYEVIGVLSQNQSRGDWNETAIIPISTMQARFGDIRFNIGEGSFSAESYELTRLELLLSNGDQKYGLKKSVQQLLSSRHKEMKDFRVSLVTTEFGTLEGQEQKPVKRDFVLEMGSVEPEQSISISSLTEGQSRVKFVVPEGTKVLKGDTLVELVNNPVTERFVQTQGDIEGAELALKATQGSADTLARQLEAASSTGGLAIEAAELELKSYFGDKGKQATEVGMLKRKLKTATLQVEVAQKIFDQRMSANSSGLNSNPSAVAEAKLKLQKSKDEVANTEDAIRLLEGPVAAHRRKTLELALARARAALAAERTDFLSAISQAKVEEASARTAVRLAKARYTKAQSQLDSLKVVAPIDGTVLYSVSSGTRGAAPPITLRPGAIVRERQEMLKIIDLSKLQIRVRVHESRIAQVKKGQECRIVVDALPNDELRGVVRTVATRSIPGSWPNTDLREFEVVVSLEKPSKMLRPGMTCEVRIFE